MKTALAFTGGVDSTYLLWKLLTETQDEVTAFRLRVATGTPTVLALATAEDVAAPAVVSWLKTNVRDFKYQSIPLPAYRPKEWASLECARVGGLMVQEGTADRFLIGRNAEAAWTVADLDADPEKKNVLRRQLELFREYVPNGSLEQPLKDAGLGKVHAYRDLPPALMALTVKCKRPKVVDGVIVECGKCDTGCLLHQDIQNLLSQGYSTDVVTDHIHKTRRHGKYIGLHLVGGRTFEDRTSRYDALR